MQKAFEAVKRMVHVYVKRGHYLLNPDEEIVTHILRGLAYNKVKHGLAYCPCRAVTGSRQRDAPNICPCRSHKADIEATGTCECGLFVSRTYAENVKRS
ncbi:MAG: ferredoxin-thioredoxin reductase catalytic domain-containing protein [Candidatus Bathyarchaeia archaeon]